MASEFQTTLVAANKKPNLKKLFKKYGFLYFQVFVE